MCPLYSKKHNKNDKSIIFSSEAIGRKIFTHSATEKRKVEVLFHCDQMKYISPGEGGILVSFIWKAMMTKYGF